jgi:hypothetical protein
MLSTALLLLMRTLVGNEIRIALVHPLLYKLPDECHLRTAKSIAGFSGRVRGRTTG